MIELGKLMPASVRYLGHTAASGDPVRSAGAPLLRPAVDRTGSPQPAAGPAPAQRQQAYREMAAAIAAALAAALPEPVTVSFRWVAEHELFVLEVRNAGSGELVKQYPPEKILNLRRCLDDLLGVMVDRQV